MVYPSRREFQESARSGQWVPVAACLPLDSTPQALFESVQFRSPHILLESARIHPGTGRYSILVGEPSQIFSAKGNRIRIEEEGGVRSVDGDPFVVLEQALKSKPALRLPGFPPFVGGAVGFFSYDAARLLEKIPSLAQDDLSFPEIGFLFCDQTAVVDHLEAKIWAIVLASPKADYDAIVSRVEALICRLRRSPEAPLTLSLSKGERAMQSTHARSEFEAMVRRAKAYIADGDIYQANLSQRLSLPLNEEPWSLYQRLTQINPSPFAAYADFGFLQVASASPERFIRVSGREIETRPIAGTRPRGQSALETARLRRELILNEKERAEHLMLVDLERNDLGRICRYGSVKVDDLMALEEYSHVIHIVSNVRGILKENVSLRDLMAATFPGGTITGCPKIRSMEVIEELEPVRRHLYTGALGYLSYTGDLDLNLLIRSAFLSGGQVHVQAGAGIVADSDPAMEYEETLHKAKALLELFAPEAEPAAHAFGTS